MSAARGAFARDGRIGARAALLQPVLVSGQLVPFGAVQVAGGGAQRLTNLLTKLVGQGRLPEALTTVA